MFEVQFQIPLVEDLAMKSSDEFDHIWEKRSKIDRCQF